MAHEVVVLRPPKERCLGVPRGEFGDDNDSVEIGNDACDGYDSPIPAVETTWFRNPPTD